MVEPRLVAVRRALSISCVFALLLLSVREACPETVAIKGKIILSNGDVPTVGHVTVGSATHSKQVEVATDGTYQIPDLPPGTYGLMAFGTTLHQLGTYTQKGIEIRPDTPLPLTINITLPATPTAQ